MSEVALDSSWPVCMRSCQPGSSASRCLPSRLRRSASTAVPTLPEVLRRTPPSTQRPSASRNSSVTSRATTAPSRATSPWSMMRPVSDGITVVIQVIPSPSTNAPAARRQ
jgi:hypothetical protein